MDLEATRRSGISSGMKRVLLLAAALAALTAPASAGDRVLAVGNCLKASYKPRQIVLACADGGARLVRISWSRWGGRTAAGRGKLVVNTCEPSCVDGSARTTGPARITLSRRRTCSSGIRVYTHLRFKVPGDGARVKHLGCP
ncbi:MAG: hypothetical protein ACR2NB_15320 [Solirubrobacteraceae bacterium]